MQNAFPKNNLFKTITRYAAIFIAAASLSGLIFFYIGKNQITADKAVFSELFVPKGSSVRFNLPDGTSVTLNSGSYLKWNNSFGVSDRILELKGEGFFKVVKDAEKPFIVITSHLKIRALGTSFNVKAYADDKTIETTLVEGSLKIEEITEKSAVNPLVLKPKPKSYFFSRKIQQCLMRKLIRKKGNVKIKQPVHVQKAITLPRLVTENVNVEPVISWKEDKWIFEKQSLAQIAVDLERKFDVQIIFDSERLKTFRFTGIIIAEPIEQVLQVMSISAPINFKLKGRVVTLSENKNVAERNKYLYNRK